MGENIMNENIKNQLLERNRRIIQAVKSRAVALCPGAVDLIAVAGSFASGEFHEKSDLDLLIVINDEAGWSLARAFIIGDVGHDIYCQTWEGLEHAAGYPDPHVTKLLDADIVFTANDEAEARYSALRKKLQDKLAAPFTMEDLEKSEKYYSSALETLAKLLIADSEGECRYLSAIALYYIEYVVYMANKAYVRHGIQGIPEEIGSLSRLPDGFIGAYNRLISAVGMDEIQSAAKALVKTTGAFLAVLRNELTVKPKMPPKNLEGTYEEAYSNWYWKMHRAAELDSPYLSLMTAASCQNYYDEFWSEYDVPRFDLFSRFSIKDIRTSADVFDRVLKEFSRLYEENGMEICRYASVEDFEEDYAPQ